MEIGETIQLFCCGRVKCPTIKRDDTDTYTLTDDYGGNIKLNSEQLASLVETADNLQSDQSTSDFPNFEQFCQYGILWCIAFTISIWMYSMWLER